MQIMKEEAPFIHKAATAMTISVIADALDYFAAPLFDVPVIGDLIPTYTLSTLLWISRELKKRNKMKKVVEYKNYSDRELRLL